MSDDDTRPIDPGTEPGREPGAEATTPPTAPPAAPPAAPHTAPPAAPPGYPAYGGNAGLPPYAMAMPAGPYPGYAAPERPRFVDQVLGMRAVIAVALACLLIGGLSGWILGRASAEGNDGFGGPGMVQQRGMFPGGADGQQLPSPKLGQTP